MNIFIILAIVAVVAMGALYAFVPKTREWIKAHWKILAGIVGGLFGAGVIEGCYEVIKGAVLGKVGAAGNQITKYDDHTVLVNVGGTWKVVPLPAGTTADHVTAVRVTPEGKAIVEVENASIDQT